MEYGVERSRDKEHAQLLYPPKRDGLSPDPIDSLRHNYGIGGAKPMTTRFQWQPGLQSATASPMRLSGACAYRCASPNCP